jgi:hypothetical protein
MVTATQRRQVVTHLQAAFAVSGRRACRLVALSRSRWHYQPQRPLRDAPVRARLRELAAARPRFGYVRLGRGATSLAFRLKGDINLDAVKWWCGPELQHKGNPL